MSDSIPGHAADFQRLLKFSEESGGRPYEVVLEAVEPHPEVDSPDGDGVTSYEDRRMAIVAAWSAIMEDQKDTFEGESLIDEFAMGVYAAGWRAAARSAGRFLGINGKTFEEAMYFAWDGRIERFSDDAVANLRGFALSDEDDAEIAYVRLVGGTPLAAPVTLSK